MVYGPYSVSVAHMLSAVNGKYLHGLEEMDRKPFEAAYRHLDTMMPTVSMAGR